jgi:hypothetical protein
MRLERSVESATNPPWACRVPGKRCRLMGLTHDGSPSVEARACLYHKPASASAVECQA